MDDETRKAFAKIDYWFERNEAEHARTRREINEVGNHLSEHDEQFVSIRHELSGVKQELAALKQEFHRFRDWATGQLVEVRSAIRDLSARFEAMG